MLSGVRIFYLDYYENVPARGLRIDIYRRFQGQEARDKVRTPIPWHEKVLPLLHPREVLACSVIPPAHPLQ